MNNRFLDDKGHTDLLPDFVRRRYGLPLIWLIAGFLATIAIIFIVTLLLAPQAMLGICGTASVLLLGLMAFAALYVHNSRDIIMATEFQNALFAAALRVNTEFCLILKQDGTVVYSDLQNNDMFSSLIKQGLRGLDVLLTHGSLTRKDKESLLQALSEGSTVKIPFIYQREENKKERVSLLVEPITHESTENVELSVSSIKRPEGYIVIRAMRQTMDGSQAGALLESMPIGVFILNEHHIFTYLNKTLLQWAGYSRGDSMLASLPFDKLIALPDGPNTVFPYRGKAMLLNREGQKEVEVSIISTAGDGLQEYYGTVLPSLPAVGKPVVLSGNIGDAWELFIEHSPIAVAHLDEAGNVLKSNKALRHITGHNAVAGTAWNLLDAIADDKEEVKRLFTRITSTPSHEEKPMEIRLSGQQGATAALYLWRMENMDGTSSGVLVHLIDTTEQKNLELRFVHSQKMQAVGQLAGGIAHDFNNLLTALMGFSDLLLLRHPAGDPSFADIMQIKQNANRAANLVRQLLAFSRKQTLQPEVLDITDVLAELSNLIRRLIGENIELKMTHGRDLGLVKVDQGQLEQVLINLAVNARDAMANGGTLTIQTSNVRVDKKHPLSKDLVPAEDEAQEEGDYVVVEVIDTGHGIPKAMQRKIFEPFFSTKEVGSGTGLGLSTVYGIIKQTGGYVYVTSKPGESTKFSIFLKSYRADAENELKKNDDVAEKLLPAKDLTGKETILLVEDEVPVRIFSAQALTNKGYTILEADSGEAALKVVDEKGPEIDMIITDVIMPGMNGPTMVEEVAKRYPNIKVIFMSGYAEDAFLKTYGTERKFHFLPKPFTLKQLASKVKEVVEKEDG